MRDAATLVSPADYFKVTVQHSGAGGGTEEIRGEVAGPNQLIYFAMDQECPRLTARGAWGKGQTGKELGSPSHRDSERSHSGRQGHPEKEETKGTPTLQRDSGQKRPAMAEETRPGAEGMETGAFSQRPPQLERGCGPQGPARGSPRPGTTAVRDRVLVDAGNAARPWARASHPVTAEDTLPS